MLLSDSVPACYRDPVLVVLEAEPAPGEILQSLEVFIVRSLIFVAA